MQWHRVVAQARYTWLKFRLGENWDGAEAGLGRRDYPDYETYLQHQRTKLDAMREKSLRSHDRRFYTALCERLEQVPCPLERRSVLCLAARQGSEVRAFIDRGAFAVGIDLNPGRENRYVLVGDFHDLQFASGTVDVVYTNSLDHAFDLDRIMNEVMRVLADGAHFILEVGRGTESDFGRGFYEALSWKTVDDLLARLLPMGLEIVHRAEFELPWPGQQIVFRKAAVQSRRLA